MKSGGTEGDSPERRAEETGKVVRIPRDWFGPTDELVPFGPRALEDANEPQPRVEPLDPNSFWDESSNSIQDAVEAPAEARHRAPVPRIGHAARVHRAARELPGRIGGWKAAACLAVALILGVAVVGMLLGPGQRRTSRSTVASVSIGSDYSQAESALARALRERVAIGMSGEPRRGSEGEMRERSSTSAHTRSSGAAGSSGHAGSSGAIQVVYRSSQTASSNSEPATSEPAAGSTRGVSHSATTAASTAARSQPSTPAFGAGGALGPMSSPDG